MIPNLIKPSDEAVEEYKSLLPYMWNPAIDPPDFEIVLSEPLILCEYCSNEEATNLIDIFMLPFLCCDGCKQLTYDDAHYAIGLI